MASAIAIAFKAPSLINGVRNYLVPLVTGSSLSVYTQFSNGVNFADTPYKNMLNPSRFVPVRTLLDATKYGVPKADPQGSRAIMYTIVMYRNNTAYQLEVLYDELSNSIWHFEYYPY